MGAGPGGLRRAYGSCWNVSSVASGDMMQGRWNDKIIFMEDTGPGAPKERPGKEVDHESVYVPSDV